MAQQFGRQFQVVFEHSPIGIVVMDGTGRIQYANYAVRSFLGYSEEELSGGFLTRYSHPDDSDFFHTLFSEVVDGERDRFQLVARCRPRNGTVAWWRVDITQVTAGGHTPFMLAVIDDVTSQKHDEDRLRRAKELAEAATQTKSAFLANMSHEIRTPLHTINAVADLLRDTHLDEEQEEYLQQILFAGEVLLGLINDILDFSKIEAGRLQLEKISYDPVTTIEDAVDMVSMQAHRKGLEVVLAIDHRLPRNVSGDPNRMRQVLVNLVNNAIKFTEKGFIRIDAAYRKIGERSNLLVQVRDTGIGIPRERQNRLFQPFSQVDASMTRKFGGTGLGLSISRDLVAMMDGRIGVKSKSGKGSNFWFTLPLEGGEEQDQRSYGPRELPEDSRCLVIEDNRESGKILRDYLESFGVETVIVQTGQVGIRELHRASSRNMPYTFACIDLRLPDMDGWQAASEIRNDETLNEVPLILMSPTGLSTGEAKMKLLRWFDAYISKPVKRSDLVRALESVFAGDLEELEMVDEDGVRSGASGTAETSHETYPETVLVAEDHFVNQQLFQTILEKRGFRTILAADGLEAVQCVQNHPEIGMVFMDVQMPNLNGYDATIRIRELGYTIPIVAVTANALSGERERCIRVGMNDYMSKPFKNADITAILERLRTAGAFGRRDFGPDELRVDLSADGDAIGDGSVITATAGEHDTQSAKNEEMVAELEEIETPPIDIGATVEAFMGDVETAQRVTLQFADRLTGQIDDIERWLHEGKVSDARISAHAIKGGAWNLNSADLGEAARIVEDLCADENGKMALEALADLRREVRRFMEYVRTVDFSENTD